MDGEGVLLLVLGMLVGLLLGLAVAHSTGGSYKDGQIDAQRNKIEWVLAPDGTIWHKEKSE